MRSSPVRSARRTTSPTYSAPCTTMPGRGCLPGRPDRGVCNDRHQGAGGGSGGQRNRAAAWVSSLAMRSSTSSARKASKSTKCRCSTPLAKRTREAGKALAGVCVVDLLRVGVGAARRLVVRPRGCPPSTSSRPCGETLPPLQQPSGALPHPRTGSTHGSVSYPPHPQLQPLPEFRGTATSRPSPELRRRLSTFVVEQYQAELSLRQVAELTDRSFSAVRGILDTRGVRRRPPGAAVQRRGADVPFRLCLLYTSDAADEEDSVDLGGGRI